MADMRTFEEIRTDRLLMRRWREADCEPFAELNGDPGTLVFFPSTLTRAESDAFADRIEARFEEHGYGLWALEVRATGDFIGVHRPLPDAARRARRGRHRDRMAAGAARVAPRVCHRGGAGRA
jgi:RimJ/RimL family protein N-acetyltransferase